MFTYKKRKPYRSQSKRQSKTGLLLTLLSLPLLILVLEIGIRVVVSLTGKNAELADYEGEPAQVTAYRLKFLNNAGQSYDGLPNQGRLEVQRNPLLGYQLVPQQKNAFWQINAQGFRDNDPIPLAKPKGEIRIFVLGGSTAFGQMSSSNQTTFASKLEARLNQQVAQQKQHPEKFRPDILPYFKEEVDKALARPPKIRVGQYRVINAAVPGYASGNELAQLVTQVFTYQPDIIIVLDGYADLLLPSKMAGADIPGTETLLANAPQHLLTHLSQGLGAWVHQAYLVKASQYWLLQPQVKANEVSVVPSDPTLSLAARLSPDTAELNRRVSRYQNYLQQMTRLAAANKIPLIVAIQPEITGRAASALAPAEKTALSELGSTYRDRMVQGYKALSPVLSNLQKQFPNQVTTLNLYTLYQNFQGQAFYDAVHLTDEANTVLGDRFYEVVTRRFTLQSLPYEAAIR